MSTAGHTINVRAEDSVQGEGQGAEYGLPSSQVEGHGGAVQVELPASVADKFNASKERLKGSGGEHPVTQMDMGTHKTGMEPVSERARDLTAVTQEKMRSDNATETRTPDVGFPARPHADRT